MNILGCHQYYRKARNTLMCPAVVQRVRRDHLSYLDADALCDLYFAVKQCEKLGKTGILVESGCALGGSAMVMACAKQRQTRLCVYDVFDQIPAPSGRDGADVHRRYTEIQAGDSVGLGGNPYYGYEENLIGKVRQTFSEYQLEVEQHHIELLRGLFQDTLNIREPVLLAHIDGDWYDSVLTCLERIALHLIPGGRMIVDDYHVYSGCREAVDHFLADKGDAYQCVNQARLHIIKR